MALMPSVAAQARSPETCKPKYSRSFKVFNGLAFAGQPDLKPFGLQPVHIVDRGIWKAGASRADRPDVPTIRRLIEKLPDDGAPIVMDFEDFPLIGSDAEAKMSIGRLNIILRAFRQADPSRQLGFYSMVPIFNYWQAIDGAQSKGYRKWQRQNDRLKKLAGAVDVMFPSLYTHYDDRVGWASFAKAQICEARRLSSKPVYVFLWPRYQEGSRIDQNVSPDSWQEELELSREYADGIVIWGGWNAYSNKRLDWDEGAGWWTRTKEFLQHLDGMRR